MSVMKTVVSFIKRNEKFFWMVLLIFAISQFVFSLLTHDNDFSIPIIVSCFSLYYLTQVKSK